MSDIKSLKILKLILFFALLNSSIFMAIQVTFVSGPIRLFIVLLMNISALFLIKYFVSMSKDEFNSHVYFKLIFFLLITWSLITIFRSFIFESSTLISLFGHMLMGWAWLTPLAIIFGFNLHNWKYLFSFFSKLLLFSSILALGVFFYSLEVTFALFEWMAFLPVMLITYYYQNSFNQKVIIFALLMFFILTFFTGQRANAVFIGLLLVLTLVEYFRQMETTFIKKLILFYILITGIVLFLFKADVFFDSIFNDEELTTDTRSFLVEEMFSDMDIEELVIGRGALGKYYSSYFDELQKAGFSGGDNAMRSSIEVGYLEIILKGGYIMFALYLLILIPAAYLGIFKSNNIIARMSGYFILLYLILWIVSYYPIYSAEYLLLWMAVGTAISPIARGISNKEILVLKDGRYQFEK